MSKQVHGVTVPELQDPANVPGDLEVLVNGIATLIDTKVAPVTTMTSRVTALEVGDVIVSGSASQATDALGRMTIKHGQTTAPTNVVCTALASSANGELYLNVSIDAITATDLVVNIFNLQGLGASYPIGPFKNQTVRVHWMGKVG